MRVPLRALAMAGVLALAGCASGPSGPALTLLSADQPDTIDPHIETMLIDARDAVAQRLGVDLGHVETILASKDEMASWHRQSVEREFVSLFSQKHQDRMADSIVESRLEDILAFYDATEKAIIFDVQNVEQYVSRLDGYGVPARDAAMTLFLHEWVHAADDVLVDFETLDDVYGGNNLAYSAVFEGHAELIARELCGQFNCVDSFDAVASAFRHRNAGSATLDVLPGRSGDSSTLRYYEGRRYLERLVALPDGEERVLAVLKQPPRDAVSIFAPDARLDAEREATNLTLQAALSAFELPMTEGDWIQFAGDPSDANSFSVNAERRERDVAKRLQAVRGAAETVFYEQSGSHFLLVEIRLTRAASAADAESLALDAARTFRRRSGSLIGAGVSMRNLTGERTMLDADQHGLSGTEHEVRADLYSQGELYGALSYTATASDDYVVEVVSDLPVEQHVDTVRSGRELLAALRN